MKTTAHLNYLRIAPRKVRLVADSVRGKKIKEAQELLSVLNKKGARNVLKALNSAVASAKQIFQGEESNLYVAEIRVNEGPKLKRFRARARGMAYPIQKKTSHLTIVIDEIQETKRKKARKQKGKVEAQTPAPAPKTPVLQKPKFRPAEELARPKEQRGLQRIFRRKSI